ncbi:kinase-like domain-containing protein [Cokeromyces recurvatus]|uniref:kinase-like domain-containing protein n=1 Tax=Cokeromyces recurvatus TaxID=90255 RepID=UPI002220FE4A|nr:kinase-like domain-containing protein [Cokeromyces recurvatus]KAI7898617.1 kinase-like domain-containing protein [Cokeromyces recurvatus]
MKLRSHNERMVNKEELSSIVCSNCEATITINRDLLISNKIQKPLTSRHLDHFEHAPSSIFLFNKEEEDDDDDEEDELSDDSINNEYLEISKINIIPQIDPTAAYNTRRKFQKVMLDTNINKDDQLETTSITTTNSVSQNKKTNAILTECQKAENIEGSKCKSSIESLLLIPGEKVEKERSKLLLSSQLGEIYPDDLLISDIILGEGQMGIVRLGKYRELLVACKTKRARTRREPFEIQAKRELEFAAKLSVCRYVNQYFGWIYCKRHKVEENLKYDIASYKKNKAKNLYIIQRYVPNGDARNYLDKRVYTFQPQEVLQASICLFSALTDAHALGIGIVDLKLENFLIDASGAGWLTDFGSCIEFKSGNDEIDLDQEGVSWTKNVASPEMLRSHKFSKASDIFMAMLIVAELLTADLSDAEFYRQILKRNRSTGEVSFSSDHIHKRYEMFFQLLKLGLSNDPLKRPTASSILECLLKMKV